MKKIILMVIALFALQNQSFANGLNNEQIAPEILQSINAPVVIGQTELTFIGFHFYKIALFGENKKFSYNQKLALNIKYEKNFSKSELVESSIDEISRINNVDKSSLQPFKLQLEKIFVDVKKGNEKTAIFDPNFGLTIFYNQKIRGQIKDKTFAKYFIDIWLSDKARFKNMRNKLIAQDE